MPSNLDLDSLREKLAAAAARRELAAVTGAEAPVAGLEMPVGPPNLKMAWVNASKSLLWMVLLYVVPYRFFGRANESMGQAFLRMLGCTGPLMLGMVLAAVWSLWWCVDERLRVVGSQLTLYRKLAGLEWTRTCTLGPESQTYLAPRRAVDGKGESATTQVAVTDVTGREYNLALGRTLPDRELLVKRLNEYIQSQRV